MQGRGRAFEGGRAALSPQTCQACTAKQVHAAQRLSLNSYRNRRTVEGKRARISPLPALAEDARELRDNADYEQKEGEKFSTSSGLVETVEEGGAEASLTF